MIEPNTNESKVKSVGNMNKSASHSKDLHPARTTHILSRQEIDQQQGEYSAMFSRILLLCVIIHHCHSLPYIADRIII